jgi:hypothetical protein
MGTLVEDDTGADVAPGDAFSGKLPIRIDAGWRFDPSTCPGACFPHAPGLVKDGPAGVSCSASDLRRA